jgi:hypothetical protein
VVTRTRLSVTLNVYCLSLSLLKNYFLLFAVFGQPNIVCLTSFLPKHNGNLPLSILFPMPVNSCPPSNNFPCRCFAQTKFVCRYNANEQLADIFATMFYLSIYVVCSRKGAFILRSELLIGLTNFVRRIRIFFYSFHFAWDSYVSCVVTA